MTIPLPDVLEKLAQLLPAGRIRIRRSGPTPGVGIVDTLYVVFAGREDRVSIIKPRVWWLNDHGENDPYIPTKLLCIRVALEEEVTARGWYWEIGTQGCVIRPSGSRALYQITPQDFPKPRDYGITHALALALLAALEAQQ